MALKHVTSLGVERVCEEFDRIGCHSMLEKHGGGRSVKWFLLFKDRPYDQELAKSCYDEAHWRIVLLSPGGCPHDSNELSAHQVGERYDLHATEPGAMPICRVLRRADGGNFRTLLPFVDGGEEDSAEPDSQLYGWSHYLAQANVASFICERTS